MASFSLKTKEDVGRPVAEEKRKSDLRPIPGEASFSSHIVCKERKTRDAHIRKKPRTKQLLRVRKEKGGETRLVPPERKRINPSSDRERRGSTALASEKKGGTSTKLSLV